eukprot:TRINITY_DN42864_c0_g1_i1.p1 TRINITY_DN42864_c0_g1~~TRINITY_DN42864_c0_g1_i1.p1  ORF type:complete len:263 (+),score=39.47 TRINITY_DN42864_c0_g1_i1:74-862(+)
MRAMVGDAPSEAVTGRILTVGHSNHNTAAFMSLLERYNIKALVDVRSIPSSGRFPHFKKRNLEAVCQKRDVSYRHCPELGNKVDGIAVLLQKPEGQRALAELAAAAVSATSGDRSGATAYMCAEADWRDCHRQVIAQKLMEDYGILSTHITHNGGTEDHPHNHVLPGYYGVVSSARVHAGSASVRACVDADSPPHSEKAAASSAVAAPGRSSASPVDEEEGDDVVCCSATASPGSQEACLEVGAALPTRTRRWGKKTCCAKA